MSKITYVSSVSHLRSYHSYNISSCYKRQFRSDQNIKSISAYIHGTNFSLKFGIKAWLEGKICPTLKHYSLKCFVVLELTQCRDKFLNFGKMSSLTEILFGKFRLLSNQNTADGICP